MNKYPIIALFIFCLGLFSCTKDLKLPDVEKSKKIALLGEFTANEPMLLRAGQSVPVAKGSTLQFEVLHGLSVGIKDQQNNSYAVSASEDSLTGSLYTIPYSTTEKAKAGNTYIVTAVHPDLGTALTTVTIPQAFTAVIKDTTKQVYGNDQDVLAIDMEIKDESGDNYYVIEALKQEVVVDGFFYHENAWLNIGVNKFLYDSLVSSGVHVAERYDTTYTQHYDRRMLYTADLNTENLKDNSSFNSFRRILFNNYNFKGKLYTTRVYISVGSLYLTNHDFKGRFILQVKSVSREYYNYLRRYELYDGSSGYNSFSPSADIPNSVQNGIGIIGGVYKLEFSYILDLWDF